MKLHHGVTEKILRDFIETTFSSDFLRASVPPW